MAEGYSESIKVFSIDDTIDALTKVYEARRWDRDKFKENLQRLVATAKKEALQPTAERIDSMSLALSYYAEGKHYGIDDANNWKEMLCGIRNYIVNDQAGVKVESGEIARKALMGERVVLDNSAFEKGQELIKTIGTLIEEGKLE